MRITVGGSMRTVTHGALLLAIALSHGACRARSTPVGSKLAPPSHMVVSDESVVIVPGTNWLEENGQWKINDEASMYCYVLESTGPVVFDLHASAALPAMEILWDETDLPGDVIAPADGVLRVTIPRSRLAPGPHELTYRLLDTSRPATVTSIAVESDSGRRAYDIKERMKYAYLASLLGRGVTGIDTLDNLGGLVFLGASSVDVVAPPGGMLTTTVENGSHDDATFVLSDGGGRRAEYHVSLLERTEISLAVPADLPLLHLEVEGASEGAFLWGAPVYHPETRGQRPPVILVTLDTTRRDVLGAYGGPSGLTPSIDALAESATVFQQAYSTTSWTLPAHASIFTGLYPTHHGAGVATSRLVPSRVTLAELLRDAGYDTAGYPGGLLCGMDSGLAQGFLTYREIDSADVPDKVLTENAVDRIEKSGTAPLFLFVNYFGPHFPYEAPDDAKERAGEDSHASLSPALRKILDDGDGAEWGRLIEGEVSPTEDEVRAVRLAYLASVSDTDAELGKLLEALKRKGIYDDALIIVVADHGELLGENGFFSHSTRLDDELVAVPMIVKWPGQHERLVQDQLVSIVDLFPTILAAAGLSTPPSDGIALSPATSSDVASRPAVVVEEHDRPFHTMLSAMKIDDDVFRIVGRGRFTFVTNKESRCAIRVGGSWRELECSDPDAADMPAIPQLVRQSMSAKRAGKPQLSAEQIRNLRALGYMR